MKMYFFLQNYLMNEQSTILHQDGISSTTRTWGLKDERFIPIRQISSASIIEVRNILWLIIGLLTL